MKKKEEWNCCCSGTQIRIFPICIFVHSFMGRVSLQAREDKAFDCQYAAWIVNVLLGRGGGVSMSRWWVFAQRLFLVLNSFLRTSRHYVIAVRVCLGSCRRPLSIYFVLCLKASGWWICLVVSFGRFQLLQGGACVFIHLGTSFITLIPL